MLFRKLLRTSWKYKAQFISMILMVAIGIGILLGFNAEWKSIEYNSDKFYQQSGFSDVIAYNQDQSKGYKFTTEELDRVKNIKGVEEATRYTSFKVNMGKFNENDKESILDINVIEDYGKPTKFYFTEGSEYDANSKGIYLSNKYALAHDIKLNDKLSFSYTLGANKINFTEVPVVGLIKTSDYLICINGDNQLMPDYNVFGYGYITPNYFKEVVGMEFYTQIRVKTDMKNDDISQDVKKALEGTSTVVVGKKDIVSYNEVRGEMNEGKTMGSVLPVLFIFIALLTMVTTMARITENERIQIGTLKALGFKNRRIIFHYSCYGLFIGTLGSILGIGLGYIVSGVIMNPNGMMGTYFDMPTWTTILPWFTYPLIIGTILLIMGVSFLSVKKVLKGQAAETLRGGKEKRMKKVFIEKTKLWDKMNFTNKWNTRDVLRNKPRSIVTLVGVIGCMILLVAGFGMKDSMDSFLNTLDKTICNYETVINLNDEVHKEEAEKYIVENLTKGDWVANEGITIGDSKDTKVASIYHNPNNFIQVIGTNNKPLTLTDDGIYVCIRVKDEGYKVGETIKIHAYGEDSYVEGKVVGVVRSLTTNGIFMSDAYADKIGFDYHISSIYTNETKANIKDDIIISNTQTKRELLDTYDSFTQIMNTMIIVLSIAAVVLGIIVLYNLGVMSYVERYRELATLKVLGFKDGQVGRILITQNIWLTIIGVILGLPLGVLTLKILLITLAGDYEMSLILGVLTYSVSVILTIGVSLLVGLMVARKNKKINMVEALKNAE